MRLSFGLPLFIAALAAVTAKPAPHPAPPPYDAIVVGAGLSGLGAAKHLTEAGKRVLVLEARTRVGGRVHNAVLPGGRGYTEVGAEFIGPTQDKVIALAQELGLTLFEEYNTGNNVLFRNKQRSTFQSDGITGAVPTSINPISLAQLAVVQGELDQMASTIDVERPWNATLAAVWDAQTLDHFFSTQALTPDARFLLDTAVESIFSVEAKELSLLYALAYIAAAGNESNKGTLERLTQTHDGAQMYKVDGGTELLATRLATVLRKKGTKIILGAPVKAIKQVNGSKGQKLQRVTLRNGTSYSAAHVIVAMSPPLAGSINYTPSLPSARQGVTRSMYMGSIGKAIALYDTPFWRQDGLTGQAISDAGLARTTFDQSDRNAKYGGLMGFLEAAQIREYDSASDATIQSVVKKDFVNYFGAKAANVRAWVVFRWDKEEFSRGGPVAIAGPNVYTQYGPALRAPVADNTLHFAGTESALFWVGYMDGALQSGYRAAAEVLSG